MNVHSDNSTIISSSISVEGLSVSYGGKKVLDDVSVKIPKNSVTTFIGSSGCGKSTFLRCLNRMNDYVEDCLIDGKIFIDGFNIYDPKIDPNLLRTKVGMLFQKPTPFPRSIYDNVAYGLKLHKLSNSKSVIDEIVITSLKKSGLYHEVSDRLHDPALTLSGGQQQRLCLARTIAINPEIILMDEPCSALDPVSTAAVEKLIVSLKDNFTIIVITHRMEQIQKIADFVGFFYKGRLLEFGKREEIVNTPKYKQTKKYMEGH